MEINPVFSLPIQQTNNPGESDLNWFDSGSVPGYSLLNTIQGDVTVNHAALRIVADVSPPSGVSPVSNSPAVDLMATEITGIAAAAIHFSNLVNSVLSSFNFPGLDDLSYPSLTGLSIQLPSQDPVATTVTDTPSGVLTTISSLLSANDAAFTAGPVSGAGNNRSLDAGPVVR